LTPPIVIGGVGNDDAADNRRDQPHRIALLPVASRTISPSGLSVLAKATTYSCRA
jgi:hypothetical protein